MGDLGVFEAMANAGKMSAAAAAEQGFELEKNIDRAIFRAKEMFGAYLANSQSRSDFEERWSGVKPQVIKVIAEVTTPTPGVIRRVGAALRPSLPAPVATKKNRPSSAKTARDKSGAPWLPAGETIGFASALNKALAADVRALAKNRPCRQADLAREAAVTKTAWSYDQSTKLWTSRDPLKKFACPDCGTEQEHLGFTHCAGCDRTWNSWPVRQAGGAKTGASTYVLMAREIKMRGDQFKLATASNIKVADSDDDDDDKGKGTPFDTSDKSDKDDDDKDNKSKKSSATKVAMPMQPNVGTMPGDNSAAMGSPAPPEQPPTPVAAAGNSLDGDDDVAGGITEDSPIDQIQDALQDAVMALKDVQMLSINPALMATSSTKAAKVTALRTAMDRFWGLHKQMNYVAGMLAKEANEAIKSADPRITTEAEFIAGFKAAANNMPLPAPSKTARAWLEGYVAFHKQADSYSDGADYGRIFEPAPDSDETTGTRNEGTFLSGTGLDDARADTSDAGPFDTSQPAQQEAARQFDQDNAAGGRDRGQGQSGSIQPTGARRTLPKGRR